MSELKKAILKSPINKRTNKKKQIEAILPGKSELIAEIDKNLKHLKGQKKILRTGKQTQTWVSNFLSNQTEMRSISKKTQKCDCKKICDALQEIVKKNCVVRVTDSSTQFEPHLHPEQDRSQWSREPIKSMEESHSEPKRDIFSKSKKHNSRPSTKKGTQSVISQKQKKIRQNFSREMNLSHHTFSKANKSTKATSMNQHSHDSPEKNDLKCHRTRFNNDIVNEGFENNATYLQRSKREKSLNLSSHRVNFYGYKQKEKQIVIHRTPSSEMRHTELLKDIQDFARLPKNQRPSRSHTRQSQNYSRLYSRADRFSSTKKETKIPNSEDPDISSAKTFRVSEKKPKFQARSTVYQIDAAKKMSPKRDHHSNYQAYCQGAVSERSHFKRSPKTHDKIVSLKNRGHSKLKTNNLSTGSSSSNLHKQIMAKPNIIDDSTYICPNNSEENDYLILPYLNEPYRDEFTKRPSKDIFTNLPNDEKGAKSSRPSASLEHPVDETPSKLELIAKSLNQTTAHEKNKKFSKYDTEKKIENPSRSTPLSQTDLSDYFSHKLEATWESHIHYPYPTSEVVKSKFRSQRNRLEESPTKAERSEFSGLAGDSNENIRDDRVPTERTSESSRQRNNSILSAEMGHRSESKTNILQPIQLQSSEAKKLVIGRKINNFIDKNAASNSSDFEEYEIKTKPFISRTNQADVLGEPTVRERFSYPHLLVNYSTQRKPQNLTQENTSLSSERWKLEEHWFEPTSMLAIEKFNETSSQLTVAIDKNKSNVISRQEEDLKKQFASSSTNNLTAITTQHSSELMSKSEQSEPKVSTKMIQEPKNMDEVLEPKQVHQTNKAKSTSYESLVKHDTPGLSLSYQSKSTRMDQLKSHHSLSSKERRSINSTKGSEATTTSLYKFKMHPHSIYSHKSGSKAGDDLNERLIPEEHSKNTNKQKLLPQMKNESKLTQKRALTPRAESSALGAKSILLPQQLHSKNENKEQLLPHNDQGEIKFMQKVNGSTLGAIPKRSSFSIRESEEKQFESKPEFSTEKKYKIQPHDKLKKDIGWTKPPRYNFKTELTESSSSLLKTELEGKQKSNCISTLSLKNKTFEGISDTEPMSEQKISETLSPKRSDFAFKPILIGTQANKILSKSDSNFKTENDLLITSQSDPYHYKRESKSGPDQQKDVLQSKLGSTFVRESVGTKLFSKSHNNISESVENKNSFIKNRSSSTPLSEVEVKYRINQPKKEFDSNERTAEKENPQHSNLVSNLQSEVVPSTSADGMKIFHEMRLLKKDDSICSELSLKQCCNCNCGQLTTDSSEIPPFEGCDCMKDDYYEIMRIAYNK